MWSALGERLRSPWQGVEAVLHLGGQVRAERGSGERGRAQSVERLGFAFMTLDEDENTMQEGALESCTEMRESIAASVFFLCLSCPSPPQPCTHYSFRSACHLLFVI